MTKFVLALTTYNRISYLKECLNSWNTTRKKNANWTIIIADDGSTDGTIDYINGLQFYDSQIIFIKNNRIGVHQQMNTIINELDSINFDFCFKVDDDVTFLRPGWDNLYYQQAKKTGYQHLVFCDTNWCSEQLLTEPKKAGALIGRVSLLNAHGFFYTLTPLIIEKVGYMDTSSFGFRGMGHVDYTMRCAKAGFTNNETPWDIQESNLYLSASKLNYHSVLPSKPVEVYDELNRKKKEKIILEGKRLYIPDSPVDQSIHKRFKTELIEALTIKVKHLEKEKKDVSLWYEQEIKKIKEWNSHQYKHIPKWYLSLAKIFKVWQIIKQR